MDFGIRKFPPNMNQWELGNLSLGWIGQFLVVTLAILLAFIIERTLSVFFLALNRRDQLKPEGKTILITGGSQGLGLGAACQLASRGAHVLIVARNLQKLQNAIKIIRSNSRDPLKQRFGYIQADVSLAHENERILREACEWNHGEPPDIIWACAGFSHPSLFLDTEIQTLRDQMDINYWAATYLLHGALKAWLKPLTNPSSVKPSHNCRIGLKDDSRHFIFTSSTVAFLGVAGYSPYSPCKAALRSLCDSIRQELVLYEGAAASSSEGNLVRPIRLHLVTPGNILSPGYEQENRIKHPVTKKLEEGDNAQQPDVVANTAIKALEKGDYLVTTNLLGRAMKSASLNGSPRNGYGVIDSLMGIIATIAYLFVIPDMERTIFKWGKERGFRHEQPYIGKFQSKVMSEMLPSETLFSEIPLVSPVG